jgi:tetratricopeptide (TPR) repeat protein
VKKVTVFLDELINKILSDQNQRQHHKIDEAFSISIFSTSAGEGQSTSEINGHFIHLQLLINCLVQMKSNSTDKIAFISLCRKYHEDNNAELKILDEFESEYSSSSALWWYTRQSFLYRLLNKALRVQNVDLLFLFRFFIRHIEQQLENNKCTSRIYVYRGQLMSTNEVEVLKKSVGEFISINSFLSTSLNRTLALFFNTDSNVSNDLERVFFEIEADPQLENIKPFSNITSQSYFPNEEEVLFMIGSIFQLIHVDLNQDGIWMIRMKLCSGNDHQLKSLFEHMKNKHHEEEDTLFSFCDILLKMGKYNDAEKYCHRLIKELSPDHKSLVHCYYFLGRVCMDKDDLDSSLIWLNKSLEIKLRTLKSNDPEVARVYYSIGKTYRKKDELDRAIEMFEKALVIWKKTVGDNSPKLAKYYTDIGNVYQRKQKFLKALKHHQKALNINEKYVPKYHIYLGASHINIATAHRCLENYDRSLEHAKLALEIFQKCLPSEHQKIGWVFENIGLIYEKQGEFQTSLSYLEKAVNTYRQTLPVTHYYITDVERNIQRVSSQLEQDDDF